MDSDPTVQTILSFYFRQPDRVRQIEPLGSAGGWSGSRLWRIESDDAQSLCLRRWPLEHPSPDRLQFIHGILAQVARQGMTIIPAPLPTLAQATYVEHANHRWELTRWLPGQADFHANPTPLRLRSAFRALAQFHRLSSIGQEPSVGQAPCLADRQRQLNILRARNIDRITSALSTGPLPQFDHHANAILMLTRDRLADLAQRIDLAAWRAWPLQPAIRDIHHDHVLFTGAEVTGIVDFGALRIDSPLTDIARLVGSLVGDNFASRQFALAAYSELLPLAPFAVQQIDLLDESGLVLGGLNWLNWLYLERRDMGPPEPILKRLDEIIARLNSRPSL